MDYTIIIYIIFGLLPSLVWLSYYLTKDLHPEPKKMILKIFLWGAFITLPVFFIQLGLAYVLTTLNITARISDIIGFSGFLTFWKLDFNISDIIYWFVVIASTEEFFKYFVVRMKIFNSPHLDEPLDIMLYMVVSALGFAAVENILYLFAPAGNLSFDSLIGRTLIIAVVRFVGSTFLHTLCSALIGYFAALSFMRLKKRHWYTTWGIIIALILHGTYDFSLMALTGTVQIAIPVCIILALASFVFYAFAKMKAMRGLCMLD